MSDSPLLLCQGLQVGYRGRPLLPPIDLRVQRGETWALIGPNGAGKTTLLRTLLGLLPALGGQLVHPGSAIAYVPQRSELDPSVPARVLDLVRSGAERGWSFAKPRWPFASNPAVLQAMRDVGVENLCREPWLHLSEGQKQRVLLAQALAGQPDLLILDEPTSAMDVHAERQVFDLLGELRDRRRLGLLLVSHNLGALSRFATHAVFVDKDQGVVVPGPLAEVVAHPAFDARFGVHVAQRGGDAS
ncbi:MAG: ATP-binding cassette domain-containing protein [Deltaproteobacteria bacterium]|nr:ATP-binding cassette domain-containing protein [Deltaproteobacteria bacterium]